MNNKLKKHCEVTLLCCLCIGLVAGSNNLKIFKNVDDTVVEVSSKIEVPSGANLTLICQIENIKNEGIVNGNVTWFIPPNVHSELKLRTLKNLSNLEFRNVNINDEGLYVCASLKFKIFKHLHLLVKQSKSAMLSYLKFPRLTKREILPGNGPFDFNSSSHYDRDLTERTNGVAKTRDISDIVKELKKENKNRDYELYNNNNYDVSLNNHKDSHSNSVPVKPVTIILGVFFAILVIFILIRFCGYMSQNSSQHSRDNRQQNINNPEVTVPRLNRCGHASCSRNYLLNPAGACRFHDNMLPTAPTLFDEIGIESHLHITGNHAIELDLSPIFQRTRDNLQPNINNPRVTVPRPNRCGHATCSRNHLLNPSGACRFHGNIRPSAPVPDIINHPHNTRNPTTRLDSPPSYSSSAHNSTQNLNDATDGFTKKNLDEANSDNLNLPPSYDEAVGRGGSKK